ncbi:MAG: dTDP-4-dehydrorhamnose 3,5-epimerase [Rhodospirillaceae bacterium]|nr:dTDP-4-dehydrorhamnose 3,5-epimerase [Rhodospirillaceae bacterium]
MNVESLSIPEVKLIRMKKHGDARGFFSETFKQAAFADAGIDIPFVQDNHVLSPAKGTLRGLHFQSPPFDQAKLVRVARGAIFDIVVDIRVGSPTYGKTAAAIISAENWSQIFIPSGFAHGLLTLEPDTEVLYKVSNYYAPKNDFGLLWNDPALGIDWPLGDMTPLLSERDKLWPKLADLPAHFTYQPGRSR